MTIYIDNGETVKIYPVKVKIAKAIETLLESDCELVWSETPEGFGVEIIDKENLAGFRTEHILPAVAHNTT